MPKLEELLKATLIFKAAEGFGKDLYQKRLKPSDPVTFPKPVPDTHVLTELEAQSRSIWYWSHDPTALDTFTGVTCMARNATVDWNPLTQGQGKQIPPATVFEEVKFSPVRVKAITRTVDGNTTTRETQLPLEPRFALFKFFLRVGEVKGSNMGLWQIPANVDSSLMIVFAYNLMPDGSLVPVSVEEAESDTFMPGSTETGMAGVGVVLQGLLGQPRFLLCVSLVCCKERADFEPGGVVGVARAYPHTMFLASIPTMEVESKISFRRPTKTAHADHSDSMLPNIGSMLVTDTNTGHELVPPGPPLPQWHKMFDYYDLRPSERLKGKELVWVDPDLPAREISDAIMKLQLLPTVQTPHLVHALRNAIITKVARQGAYDNIHMAPKMQLLDAAKNQVLTDVAMAPFCAHDCLHMHVRWGLADWSFGVTGRSPTDLPKSTKGFVGSEPYKKDGAPMVPDNQRVAVAVTAPHAFTYRAQAGTGRGSLGALQWQCFMHHGLGYAVFVGWTFINLAQQTIQQYAIQHGEPRPLDVDAGKSMTAFYWRLRFGSQNSDVPKVHRERIEIHDLTKCEA